MSTRDFQLEHKLIDEAVAVGKGLGVPLGEFRHKALTLVLAGFDAANDSVTIKVQGSNSKEKPNWATKTAENRWSYINLINEEDSSDSVAGDTGIVKTGASVDGVYNYAINTNNFKWFNVEVAVYTGDTATKKVTAYISAYNNG